MTKCACGGGRVGVGGGLLSFPCATWLVLLIRVRGHYSLLPISFIGALLSAVLPISLIRALFSATNIFDRGTILCYQYLWSGLYSLLPISLIGALFSATNIFDHGTILCYQYLWSGHYPLLPISLIGALFSANSILDRGTILCYQYLWSGHYSLLPVSLIGALFSATNIFDQYECPFSSKAVGYGHCLVTLTLTVNEAIGLSLLPILTQYRSGGDSVAIIGIVPPP